MQTFDFHLDHPEEIARIVKVSGKAACGELMAVIEKHMVLAAFSNHLPCPFCDNSRSQRATAFRGIIDIEGGIILPPLKRVLN